jgi:CDP-diacylglycerol---glycerol-3-phosphate 3-phosphatidyltransferase
MKLIGEAIIQGYLKAISPIENWFVKSGIHPNMVTWAGLVLTVIAANFFRIGSFVWAGLFMGFAGTCDVLDGRIARKTGKKSDYGAFFDSTIDRYSDVIVFVGLMMFFNEQYVNILIIMAITGSLLTSYARARAEGLGIDCKVGLMQRPERVAYIAVASFFNGIFEPTFLLWFGIKHILVIAVLWFVAIMANITVLQRIVHMKRILQETK